MGGESVGHDGELGQAYSDTVALLPQADVTSVMMKVIHGVYSNSIPDMRRNLCPEP